MEEMQLIKKETAVGEPWQSAGEREVYLVATNKAYDFLSEYRENSGLRIFARATLRMFEKALSSVVLPILVSVLTVLILKWFDNP